MIRARHFIERPDATFTPLLCLVYSYLPRVSDFFFGYRYYTLLLLTRTRTVFGLFPLGARLGRASLAPRPLTVNFFRLSLFERDHVAPYDARLRVHAFRMSSPIHLPSQTLGISLYRQMLYYGDFSPRLALDLYLFKNA
jgi:hypothetical protein